MFSKMNKWLLGALGAVALSTCAACSNFMPSQTIEAVQTECLTLDQIDKEALCLIGTYAITVDELAEERELGNIPAAVEGPLDTLINETAPRVEAAALAWGAVISYREYASEIQGNVSEEQYLIAVGVFQEAFAEAVTDWATLRPKILELVTLKEEIAE